MRVKTTNQLTPAELAYNDAYDRLQAAGLLYNGLRALMPLAKRAHAPRTLDRLRKTITSAQGAVRNAECNLSRAWNARVAEGRR